VSRVPAVAILGGGIAGLSCARALAGRGISVELFEKSRGLGGRLAQRRLDGHGFDLGAQYATARSSEFQAHLKDIGAASAQWQPAVYTRRNGALSRVDEKELRLVGVPAMQSIARALPCAAFTVRLGLRIREVVDASGLYLVDESGQQWGPYQRVVCTAPAPQAAALLRHFPSARMLAEQVAMQPCIAVAVRFVERLISPADAIFADGVALSWAAREASKPGRLSSDQQSSDQQPGSADGGQHGAQNGGQHVGQHLGQHLGQHFGWTLHAGPAWSLEHWEQADWSIISELAAALAQQLQLSSLPTIEAGHVHRWRFAQAPEPLQLGAWVSADRRLLMAGDWLNGNRVEGAFLSGLQAAAHCAD